MPEPGLVLVLQKGNFAYSNDQSESYEWADENGLEVPSVEDSTDPLTGAQGKPQFWRGISGTNRYEAILTYRFPRRSKTLQLKVVELVKANGKVTDTTVKRVVFLNPFRPSSPPWKSNGLPQEATLGDLKVRLANAVWGVAHGETDTRIGATNVGQRTTLLQLDFHSNGHSDTNWGVRGISSADASGNHFESFARGKWTNGLYSVWFSNGMWPTEPIRYRIELVREFNFPAADCLTISNLPIPLKGGVTVLDLATNLLGQRFVLDGFADANVRPPWREYISEHKTAILHVTEQSMKEGMYLKMLGILRDGEGDSIIRMGIHGRGQHTYLIDSFGDAKTATVKFAIQKSQWVEFTVQPAIASFSTKIGSALK